MFPIAFKFSQSSLQDYVDCPRRFQLRYIKSQAWPGIQTEPLLEHERHVVRGTQFHRLVERHQLGIPESMLVAGIEGDPDLLAWWQAYLGFEFLHTLGGQHYPEYMLSVRIGDVVLSAMYDLLVVVPGERVVIFDWKTYAQMPSRQWLEGRLQTCVYLYVLCSVGSGVFGGELWPEQVLMVYWVSGQSVFLEYDAVCFERDRVYLLRLVSDICAVGVGGIWSLAVDGRRCGFCEYRSLCGRGVEAVGFEKFRNEVDNIACGELGFWGLFDVEGFGF